MAKIVKLYKSNIDHVVEGLEHILAMAKEGKILNFIFAGKMPEGGIATSWALIDLGKRMELIGHLQADIMLEVVTTNLEFIEG